MSITAPAKSEAVLKMFLDDWLDDECIGNYSIASEYIHFENTEDASYVKLKSLPAHLSMYIKIA